ncbi:MAG: bifunctional 4-hydroxy-2-oxoglutarate aldolase/2-dehydro-3-deoxy-phosphogluconate aldolase [Chloroflexi bacterium]|nr:bifunctional 4-hydroxy-2-oxoglutarate aldolase/2-dehydro-3-deoxy-phosphogluconate aldolase [Chloroflexota bacterium]MBV9542856.1 bifunctional 4-hydroxy-2-oxoglutarate aldolase/2-dehydro-3-deoxy-phosphogluconate aldolase [Chloroflexota bacterium]
MKRPSVPDQLEQSRVVAIMRHTDPSAAVKTVEALLKGGVCAIEVTFNSRGVLEMIRDIDARFGNGVLLGAGTVLSRDAAEQALQAGAKFIVSPHTDAQLVCAMADRGVPCIPGALTATEIVTAWNAGASVVKLFPAASVGIGYLKDMRGPLNDIPLLPTGGISLDNAAEFMRAGAWGLGIGSSLVDSKLIAAGDFAEITRRARGFSQAAAAATPR